MSVLLLESKDNVGEFLRLDTETGDQRFIKKDDGGLEVDGVFAEVEETLLMFYREGGDLFFQVEHERIDLNDAVESILDRTSTDTLFVLLQGEHVLLRFNYDHNALDGLIAEDDTAFIDAEDFDFCLFVYNVINDPSRRRRIFRETD